MGANGFGATPYDGVNVSRDEARAERSGIRVVIVENHETVLDSLERLLNAQPDMEVVATARSVDEAVSLPAGLAPDIVVMDFHLDDGTGRDATIAMRGLHPRARFVFLSRDGSDDTRLAAVEAGASAYLLKSGPASEVIDAVRRVTQGETLISPNQIARLVSKGRDRAHVRDSLSPRELDVLELMADGVATREIGHRLGISYSTVRTHVRSISAKLGTKTMVNAVLTGRELELVS